MAQAEQEGTDVTTRATPARFGPWGREVRAFLELFALTGIAVALPAFDVLEGNASIFVSRGTTGTEIVFLALVIVLVPALVLWSAEVACGVVLPRARPAVHIAFAGIVVWVLAIEALKERTTLGPRLLLVAGLPFAALGGWLLWRYAAIRLWLLFLAVAPVIFAVLFVAASPVTDVVFDTGTDAVAIDIDRPSRVVFVVLDELPVSSLLDGQGHIDRSLFPNFAALSDDATWYRNTTTVSQFTLSAVPALISGTYPASATELPNSAQKSHNLFTLLGKRYEMNVHESVTRLCARRLCPRREGAAGADSGFVSLVYDSFDLWRRFASPVREAEGIDFSDVGVGDQDPLDTGRRFVRSLGPTSGSRLDFLHVLLPHVPWHYLPSGQDYQAIGGVRGLVRSPDLKRSSWWRDEWSARLARQRHLLQVAFADDLVGRIIAKLRRIGAYDDTLLVVTADHGIAFVPGEPMRAISEENEFEIVRPPLFVKAPGQTDGRVDDRPAQTIDVFPTIMELLSLQSPWALDGRSLMGRPAPEGPRRVLEWGGNDIQAPPGQRFITVSGAAGFARSMRGRASDAAGDPSLRLYRIGPHADLIGRRVAALSSSSPPRATATLDYADRFRDVDPKARDAPWAYVSGSLEGAEAGTAIAISVNGTVAGLSGAVPESDAPAPLSFWAMLPPQLFRRGPNDVAVHLVRGQPGAAQLERVRVVGT
jgi:hypothetical protein